MKVFSVILVVVNFGLISKINATPVGPYFQHVVVEENSIVDDDGHVVQVSNVVEEQEPMPQLSRALDSNLEQLYNDEDEEEIETVAGPGYQGILGGLTGIFSNVVKGNLGQVVESTFKFVPPAHQPSVQGVYNSLLGKPAVPASTEGTVAEVVPEGEELTGVAPVVASEKPKTIVAKPAGSGDDEEDDRNFRKLILKFHY